MICLGLDAGAKEACVARYVEAHGCRRVIALGPAAFQCDLAEAAWVEWAEIIQYRHYYRLLQEIDGSTLLVVNECLRTQQRHDLTYNCLRNFLQQTTHQIVFQRLPLIDTFDDFMILVDFDTRSRWRREPWHQEMRRDINLVVHAHPVALGRRDVPTDANTRAGYATEKRRLIDGIGLRDPHTIPRRLHLLAGRAKALVIDPAQRYVGRNNRFQLPNMETYANAHGVGGRTVFEFCHRFIDFSDFLARAHITDLDALVSDLPADGWYFQRFTQWTDRLRDAYATLHG